MKHGCGYSWKGWQVEHRATPIRALDARRQQPHPVGRRASRPRWNGGPLDTIQRAPGHATIGTTAIYTYLPTQRQHEEIAEYLR